MLAGDLFRKLKCQKHKENNGKTFTAGRESSTENSLRGQARHVRRARPHGKAACKAAGSQGGAPLFEVRAPCQQWFAITTLLRSPCLRVLFNMLKNFCRNTKEPTIRKISAWIFHRNYPGLGALGLTYPLRAP